MVNSKMIVGIVIGLIIIAGISLTLFLGPGENATGETVENIGQEAIQNPEETEGVVIEMSSDSFSPSEITISQGDSVTFVNVGTRSHWPASDAHPVHDIYPQFDSRKGISPGESWSFTFERLGTWEYHDHRNPGLKGTIKITD
ncbi:MAG: cupredoxin domain-containing protein [Candidatus Pacearchaeota archaeon]